ncbi:Kiwa anti-phage protein KwaB-like domain-containing protein [Facklamia sp. P12955]|uniref:Kiwa anti-phage protein KwaB-like domain-containing protein n=1 Tax=Facklamia sp. P12955 TaxID=3421946 RepID=UPI003D18508A
MELRELTNKLQEDDLNFNLYFTRKLRNGNYVSFSPNIDAQIFDDLLNLIIEYLGKFEDKEIIQYDPTGYKDGTIEQCTTSYINDYKKVIESFEKSDKVETEIDPDNYNFYTFEIKKEDKDFPNIKIFRRVTKFKKLHSKGIIARFNGNTLNKIESKLIGIDGEIDFIIIDEKIIILSHYSLERIFNLDEQFRDSASDFLKQDGLSEGITNFESFYEDCLNDGRYRKTLTKMTNENIDVVQTYDNHENIKMTIDMFNLEINYNEEPSFTIIYEDKSQIMDILRILRDSYYRSIINEQIGVDDK